jgi:hypothetical protein
VHAEDPKVRPAIEPRDIGTTTAVVGEGDVIPCTGRRAHGHGILRPLSVASVIETLRQNPVLRTRE